MATRALVKGMNMIMFRGKFTVSPNTLNNEIHTYFFAHRWQQLYTESQFVDKLQQNQKKMYQLSSKQTVNDGHGSKKMKKEQYSFQSWMKLIKDVTTFNQFYTKCYRQAFKDKSINTMDFRAFRLFHDWDIWGDSTSYPELKATAYFDSSRPDPIQPISEDLYLTSKMGSNKNVMANIDTDSQDMSKLFAFSLNINQQLKLHIHPSVCRTLHFRTVDSLPWTSSMGVHWFGDGNLQLLHENINKDSINQRLLLLYDKAVEQKKAEEQRKNKTEMRMLQYRYNHPTRVSSVVGYLMNTDNNESKQQTGFINYNWRIVTLQSNKYCNPNPARSFNGNTNNETQVQVFLRNVTYGGDKHGILVDLSATIMDANDSDALPVFPTTYEVTIIENNIQKKEVLAKFSINNEQPMKDLFHRKAGLYLIEGKSMTQEGSRCPISITINQTVLSKQFGKNVVIDLAGQQKQCNLQIKDCFLKTQPDDLLRGLDDISSKDPNYHIYKEYVRYKLNLTNLGIKFTGKQKLSLRSSFLIDKSGLTQYTTNKAYLKALDLQPPKDRINQLIKCSQSFRTAYPTYESVNSKVFQNKLDYIIGFTDQHMDKLVGAKGSTTELSHKFYDQKTQTFKQFALSFKSNQDCHQIEVDFANGYGEVDIYLNRALTQSNNPRHPALESLCLIGQIKVGSFDAKELNKPIKPNLTAVYFQNPRNDPYDKIDWLHVVGPKLKLMGLMYPSMQKIVNLYDYDGLSMPAMKRAFEIEDQRHSRYMPATREMSPTTHRQIRRWLYNPVYDANTLGTSSTKSQINLLNISNFQDGKIELVELLKQAFKLQLTTIPIYLSALFSIQKESQAAKLIRGIAKDEMKHLFIVSNIINALGQIPPYPLPQTNIPQTAQEINRQKDAQKYVPKYPVQDLICFNFNRPQNAIWKKLMGKIPIQSSIQEQLARFVMIEMPGEVFQIEITPFLINPQDKSYVQIKPACQNQDIFSNSKRSMLEEMAHRIYIVQKAIQAVRLELQTVKPTPISKSEKEKQNQQKSKQQQKEFLTIGMAYEKIMDYLWSLSDINHKELFKGNPSKQFTYMYLENMTPIINLRTALEQIRLITQEGEGSSMFTVTGQINKASHFIKFIQIFTGCDLQIISEYKVEDASSKVFKRTGRFFFTPNTKRFPNFPNYTKLQWSQKTDKEVDILVSEQLAVERFSDPEKIKFPNIYAPRSFLNSYAKILQELGFIFTTNPDNYKGENFEAVRLKSMENTIARMRQMTLNALHVVDPRAIIDKKGTSRSFDSASPKYNLQDSQWIPVSKKD